MTSLLTPSMTSAENARYAVEMTLWDAPKGTVAAIVGIDPTLDPQVQLRLRDIGIEPSRQLICLQRGPFGGPVVISVADTVYSLEQPIALRIRISPTV